MNTIVYEETLTGRPHDTSVQKAASDNEMWMQFNVMPRTQELSRKIVETGCSWLQCFKHIKYSPLCDEFKDVLSVHRALESWGHVCRDFC